MSISNLVWAQPSIDFSYARPNSELSNWGTEKKEIYNAAIGIKDSSLTGATITTINVPIRPSEEVDSLDLWLTSKLSIQLIDGTNRNVPDIASYRVEIPQYCEEGKDYAIIKYQLPQPVVIPDGGLYTGYTLYLNAAKENASQFPIVLSNGEATDGFYVYSSRSYRSWTNLSEQLDAVSAMSVTISATMPECAANIVSVDDAYVVAGEIGKTTVEIANVGTTEIESLSYTITIDGINTENYIDLSECKIPVQLGILYNVDIEIPPIDELGEKEIEVALNKINNNISASPLNNAKFKVTSMPFIPVYRPLIEEYTGTACPWCPRGYAAMEYMAQKYPKDFMGVAWHTYNTDDPMYATCSPAQATSFPRAIINRMASVDPYCGTAPEGFGIEQDWINLRNDNLSPIDIEVTAWLSQDESTVNARAKVTWAIAPKDGEYRIEFILVANGLKGEGKSWAQANNYNSNSYSNMFLINELFVGKGNYVELTYNDVGIADSGIGGIENSIASDIPVGTPQTTDYSFSLSSISNDINLQKENMAVIGVALKQNGGNGEVVNCNRAHVEDYASIKANDMDATIVETMYYDLSGQQLQRPINGFVIRVDIMSDGSILTKKQSFKI